jgi:hypothetical protein
MARILEDDDSLEYPRMNRLPDDGLGSEVFPAETVDAQTARLNRARMLAQDPNYPSDNVIETLAEMLARHWYS